MNKIHIANILLTRRCNLSCSYCNIIRNYKGKPATYPNMAYYKQAELDGEEWIDIIQRLVANNPNVFLVIYGGEPTLYKDFVEVIDYCNKNDVYYTVITNNTPEAQDIIYSTYEQIGRFKGLTSSVDPVCFCEDRMDDIAIKSRAGLHSLTKMKNEGVADDVVAEITITNEAIPHLFRCVEELSSRGIYSSITTIDDQKTKFYDFSNVGTDELLKPSVDLERIFKDLYHGARDGVLLIHIPKILRDIYNALPSNNFCNLNEDIHNVTIEPDGGFRLCLRVRGIHAVEEDYACCISEDGDLDLYFIDSIRMDYEDYCKGCNWSCVMMTQNHMDSIIDH